jgi:hypothetical protein
MITNLPGEVDVTHLLGKSFELNLVWKIKDATTGNTTTRDLNGWQAEAVFQFRDAELILSTENGKILLGGSNGTVKIDGTSADFAVFRPGSGNWSLTMTDPSGEPILLVEGQLNLRRSPN